MNYDLKYFDLETRVLEPLENPFGPKLLPMSLCLSTLCNPCLRPDSTLTGGGGGIRTPETLSSLTVFKTAGFNRSPTPPLLIITYSIG